jgi:hypothetical protein
MYLPLLFVRAALTTLVLSPNDPFPNLQSKICNLNLLPSSLLLL